MLKRKLGESPNSHIEFTESGEPYIDAGKLLKSKVGKELHERMKKIEYVREKTSSSRGKAH